MSGFNQTIVNPAIPPATGMGSRDNSTLVEMFPASPIYSGEITDTNVDSPNGGSYIDILQEGDVPDSGGYYGFPDGEFNRDFTNAPNIAAGVNGGGRDGQGSQGSGAGAPATQYVPNPIPPGPGSTDATEQPSSGGLWEGRNPPESSTFPAAGGGHGANPSATSANIARITMGHYGLGTSGA